MKLLIVDDEVQIRTGIQQGIDWSAFEIGEVMVAANGIEAWELYQKHAPDIVITDIRMPGMNGLDLSRRIKASHPHTPIILLSGYADFEYAQEAIQIGVCDYELKPVKLRSLLAMVRKAAGRLAEAREKESGQQLPKQTRLLKRLAAGSQSAEAGRFMPELERYFGDLSGSFVAIAMEWDGYAHSIAALPEEKLERLDGLMAGQWEELFKGLAYMASAVEEQRVYVLSRLRHIHSDMQWEATVRQWHLALNNSLAAYAGTTVTIGVSASGSLSEAQRLIQEADCALNRKLSAGGGNLFRYSGQARRTAPLLSAAQARALAEAVQQADLAAASKLLQALFQEAAAMEGIARTDLEALLIDLRRTLHYAWQEAEGLPESVLLEEDGKVAGHYETVDDYEQEAIWMYSQAIQILQPAREARSSYVIKKSVAYIKGNYDRKLTVEEMAGQCGITPNYFSHLFKKELGISFREFVNRERIGEAKRLLRTTNMLAYEIMEKVGFTDYKYFCQVFRKNEGCAPSDYRK